MDVNEMLEAIQNHYGWDRTGAYAFFTGMVTAVLTDEQMERLNRTIESL
jgi:molybdopterin synthase catalytic subunit